MWLQSGPEQVAVTYKAAGCSSGVVVKRGFTVVAYVL